MMKNQKSLVEYEKSKTMAHMYYEYRLFFNEVNLYVCYNILSTKRKICIMIQYLLKKKQDVCMSLSGILKDLEKK